MRSGPSAISLSVGRSHWIGPHRRLGAVSKLNRTEHVSIHDFGLILAGRQE